ncbi:MAG: MotB family protein [Pseudomonadota bacterium]
MEDNQNGHGEIIIVRRSGGGHEDEHHGGVWKIAFADFMTAMMAFFLVMWLINASNEQTKKAVASYFNPIKLMDTTSNPKGVKNPKYGVEQEEVEEDEDTTKVTNPAKKLISSDKANTTFDERALFVDPFALLSEIEGGIARNLEDKFSIADDSQNSNKGIGLNGGVSFQDPFDPSVWNIREGVARKQDEQAEEKAGEALGDNTGKLPDRGEAPQIGDLAASDDDIASLEEFRDEKIPEESTESEVSEQEKNETHDKAVERAVAELVQHLNTRLEQLKSDAEYAGVNIEAVKQGDGAAVVLSDKSQNGMFDIGSARPTSALVKAMSKIGDIIARHDGVVEISGHTDGRKYQSAEYDNWRLSTARAHMAYYMLLRGGMKENQVDKIVGQADVRLKVPEDPYSSSNRRIEVLLKVK